MASNTRELKLGRLFFRAYRTRGSGFGVRFHWLYAEFWIGCILFYFAVLHRKGCMCGPCQEERLFHGDD